MRLCITHFIITFIFTTPILPIDYLFNIIQQNSDISVQPWFTFHSVLIHFHIHIQYFPEIQFTPQKHHITRHYLKLQPQPNSRNLDFLNSPFQLMPDLFNILLSFGSGLTGQIPYFGFKNVQKPQESQLPHEPEQIWSNGSSTAFAKTNHYIYSWGRGEHYVLGTGSEVDSCTPTVIHQLPAPDVTEIAVSTTHAAALTKDGRVFTWGSRALGRGISEMKILKSLLGVPAVINIPKEPCFEDAGLCPVDNSRGYFQTWFGNGQKPEEKVKAVDDETNIPVSIAVGCNHSLVATKNGDLWGFGSNFDGALGLGGQDKTKQYHSPTSLPLPSGEKADKVFAGLRYSLVTSKSGKLFGAGDNSYGSVGVGDLGSPFIREFTEVVLPPTCFEQDATIVDVAAGPFHACLNTTKGELYCWGQNLQSQLGLALQSSTNRSVGKMMTPVRNEYFKNNGIFVKKVRCGTAHTAVLDSNNQVWLFGSGKEGQLSDRHSTTSAAHDTPFLLPTEHDIFDLELGSATTYLLAKPTK